MRSELNYLKWRYFHNFEPWVSYALAKPALRAEAAEALRELNERGIAITSYERLVGNDLFGALEQAVQKLERERSHEIEEARESADEMRQSEKNYAMFLLGTPRLDPESIFAKCALQDVILDLANAYFGMYTKLRSYNIWHTFATTAPARESQLWHRDADDKIALKCFIYLSDVDEGAGPFTYAPGTHSKGAIRKNAAKISGMGGRSSDEQMAEVIPPDCWITALGEKGTVILADTRGYHKGGLARTRERLMYDCLFTSQAARRPEAFQRSHQIALPSNRKVCFALKPSDPKYTLAYRQKISHQIELTKPDTAIRQSEAK